MRVGGVFMFTRREISDEESPSKIFHSKFRSGDGGERSGAELWDKKLEIEIEEPPKLEPLLRPNTFSIATLAYSKERWKW